MNERQCGSELVVKPTAICSPHPAPPPHRPRTGPTGRGKTADKPRGEGGGGAHPWAGKAAPGEPQNGRGQETTSTKKQKYLPGGWKINAELRTDAPWLTNTFSLLRVATTANGLDLSHGPWHFREMCKHVIARNALHRLNQRTENVSCGSSDRDVTMQSSHGTAARKRDRWALMSCAGCAGCLGLTNELVIEAQEITAHALLLLCGSASGLECNCGWDWLTTRVQLWLGLAAPPPAVA